MRVEIDGQNRRFIEQDGLGFLKCLEPRSLIAGSTGFGDQSVVFQRVVLLGHVRQHGVGVITCLYSGRRQEAFRQAIEFRFGKNNRRFGIDDVRMEIGA